MFYRSCKSLLPLTLAFALAAGCASVQKKALPADQNVLHLHLGFDRSILVNGKPHQLAEIGPIVTKFVAKSPDTVVVVAAPANVPEDTMAGVLGVCIRAGAVNIAQVAEPAVAK
jgi:biopolymer transport protein ExbD